MATVNKAKKTKERLTRLSGSAPGFIGLFRRAPDGRMSFPLAPPSTVELYGFAPDELAVDASACLAKIHPEDAESVWVGADESSRTGERWHKVFRYLHPTKGLRWLEGCATPNAEPDGGTVWHGVVIDVTERIVAEQRVERLSDLYRTLTEVNQALVRAKDETELYQRVCDVLMGLGGLLLVRVGIHDPKRNCLVKGPSAGPLAGVITTPDLPLDPRKPGGLAPACEAFRRGETVAINDTRVASSSDSWSRHLYDAGIHSVMCMPFRRGGRPVGILGMAASEPDTFDPEMVLLLEGTVENISFGLDSLASAAALRESESRLHFAQRMEAVGRLAGGVAHDFNNLLMVISSYTDLAIESVRPEDPLQADLDEIRKATARATTLTRQLVAFGRKQALRPRVLHLNELVAGMEPMLRRLLTEAIELSFVPDSALGRIKADGAQLENVIMNLAINARDAMPNGGKLVMRTFNSDISPEEVDYHRCPKAGPYVMLSVSDTGCGMSETTLERAFEPFFTTKPTGKGTGLGLAMVYGIIAQSGGSVRAESRLGNGSTFYILLPREDSAEAEEPRQSPAPALPRGAGTILVVEDEEAVRKLTSRMLSGAGYTVVAAANGAEALAICESHTSEIKLMLTDVVMPGMNGKELAARVAPLRPAMKVLFMSGYTGDAIGQNGIVPPGTQLISKPFKADALLPKIRGLLESS